MIKLFAKYGLLYLWLKRYQKAIITILISTAIIVLVQFVYLDVVEFLKNSQLNAYLGYALILKWLVILICLFLIVRSLKPQKESIGELDTRILEKKTLKSQGDLLIEAAKKRKQAQGK